MSQEIYEKITNKIIASLEKGEVPWKKSWSCFGKGCWPSNLITGKQYKGINVFLLAIEGYQSPFWLTYKQARSQGGWVKRGEKGTPIVFWTWFEKKIKDSKGEEVEKRFPYLKTYVVFNTDQCEHLVKSKRLKEHDAAVAAGDTKEFNSIEKCEEIWAAYKGGPEVSFDGGNRAYYSPLVDSVHLPKREVFDGEEKFYSVLFHELAHSTGSKGRLARPGIVNFNRFGSEQYSEEELVAEFSAAFLCGRAGIEPSTVENSAAYIRGWLKKLKSDKKIAVIAAGAAQKAADYIVGEGQESAGGRKKASEKKAKKAIKKETKKVAKVKGKGKYKVKKAS